jgi:4-amino-4-deoxy-L-arabinose transferase-like glycosyltransferase
MTRTTEKNSQKNRTVLILLGVITALAFALRFWQLQTVPPGWRDDELINSLVISQKIVDGDLAVYYADASGHEALYHALNGFMLAIFGPGIPGIRWLSALLGTMTVPLTYLVGRRLFGSMTGIIAAAALAVSFWSLMYSRIGIRHILTPVLALATFYFFLRGLGFGATNTWRISLGAATKETTAGTNSAGARALVDFLLAAVFMGLGFYTYFASRGVPLILLAFCIYLLLFARDRLRRRWPGLLLMFSLAALMAIPLLVTLAAQPESEARVTELAVPLVEARDGNLEPLWRHISITLNMFHTDGDDEWLYNIPHRPLFGPLGAMFFWGGVIIALLYAVSPLYWFINRLFRQQESLAKPQKPPTVAAASAFLLIWWLAGISPGFISVPPASLGHTILAQSAVYILAVLPICWLANHWFKKRRIVPITIALLLVAAIALRDLPDYFHEWPRRGMTRFLYRADIRDVAGFLNQHPEINDFGITGLLAGPWDKLALSIDLRSEQSDRAAPRWYNPERVLLLHPPLSFSGYPELETPYSDSLIPVPDGKKIGGYELVEVAQERLEPAAVMNDSSCFQNGLCLLSAGYNAETARLELDWLVAETLMMPEMPLISNPPPPGVYAGPRLHVFAQLQDKQGNFLVGDDGLWVDPFTLQRGDRFLQQHQLAAPAGQQGTSLIFGLYDPKTGERILTTDGQDALRLELEQ